MDTPRRYRPSLDPGEAAHGPLRGQGGHPGDEIDGGLDPARGGDDQAVAVDGGVHGDEGPGEPAVAGPGHQVAAGLVQRGVGGDHADRRVAVLGRAHGRVDGHGSVRRDWGVGPVVDPAHGVDRHQGRHGQPLGPHGRRGQATGDGVLPAEPLAHRGPGPRPDPTDGHGPGGGRPTGRGAALGAGTDRGVPLGQVEQTEADHDGDLPPWRVQADSGLHEDLQHTVDRGQAEDRPTAEDHGVQAGDGLVRGQQDGVAGRRGPAPELPRCHRPLGQADHGAPGRAIGVGPVADRHTIDVGDHPCFVAAGGAGRRIIQLG